MCRAEGDRTSEHMKNEWSVATNEFFSGRFNERKAELGRVYFPSLRFVAFKLLEMHGVTFGYKVPFVRTPRKLKAMEATWALLI